MWVRWTDDVGAGDEAIAGAENAALGEVQRSLGDSGIRVPPGFVVTTDAYRAFLADSGLDAVRERTLGSLEASSLEGVKAAAQRMRRAIMDARLPDEVCGELAAAHSRLTAEVGEGWGLSLRCGPSAPSGLPDWWQPRQGTRHNVHGADRLEEAVRECLAACFSGAALLDYARAGMDLSSLELAVAVQPTVRGDRAGVALSFDPDSGARQVVRIDAAYGLGDSVIQQRIDPDHYLVFRPLLSTGCRPILRKHIGTKESRLVCGAADGLAVRCVTVGRRARALPVLTDDELLRLAHWTCAVEELLAARYGGESGVWMEWAKGDDDDLWLHRVQPRSVPPSPSPPPLERQHVRGEEGALLVAGHRVGTGVTRGVARVVRSVDQLERLRDGEVLVAEATTPEWEAAMRRASAVVTDQGGRRSHAALASRALGIPAVVGAARGTVAVPDGATVTVDCTGGTEASVYRGRLDVDVERVDVATLVRPRTQILLNVNDPTDAFRLAALPNDGVGLARLESIIATHIGVHPLALMHPERVEDPTIRVEIDRLTAAYADPGEYFVDRLAEGVGVIAAAFWPKEVVVRLSDFRSSEFARLLGGGSFEPKEENPMLGLRGAARFYDPEFRDAFVLECRALGRVRDQMGLRNLKLLVPFCRTLGEAERVLEELAEQGLKRGTEGLEIHLMCEVPSNAVLAAEFAQLFDGFAIGSNDLTQLVLGVDRRSALVAHLYDELDTAVCRVVAQLVHSARDAGRSVTICGEAISEYPEFARFLIEVGADRISLNPDALLPMTLEVSELERVRTPSRRATDRERLVAEFLSSE